MDTVTLSSNWQPLRLESLIQPATPWQHPIACESTVHGQQRRYISESHARALYLAAELGALRQPQNAQLYAAFQAEVAAAALARLPANGRWIHDVSGRGETHFRFQLDGADLLLIHGLRTGDARYLECARRALQTVVDCADTLDDGSRWFLHDTFETDWQAKRTKTPTMPASRCLGKSLANTMTLNTHAQALYVLRRYALHTGDDRFEQARQAGVAALRRVLALRRNDWRARLFARCLVIALEPENQAGWRALRRRAAWKLLAKGFIRDKLAHPWLLHSSGYLDRDLAVTVFHTGYHLLNLADLLMVRRTDPQAADLAVIDEGLRFCRETPYLACLERQGRGHPRPLYLDVLLLRATDAAVDDEQQQAYCDTLAREWTLLRQAGYQPTVAAAGLDPYYTPEVYQLLAECSNNALAVLNLTPCRQPRRMRLLCINDTPHTQQGTISARFRDDPSPPWRQQLNLPPAGWLLMTP